ncbi:hypothetical protein BCR35DRAFT_309603 [Leucosporidium creatinivorum]|uniref:Uncharacterized protein n=1 Tax=Leucosporidium creatinivorum TaxID=106004 RepID=A0A1Y2DET1_9BASI|nr:hypothetical protein BCR35DRAFT_309603 [Leucosporidium creatinivorum]
MAIISQQATSAIPAPSTSPAFPHVQATWDPSSGSHQIPSSYSTVMPPSPSLYSRLSAFFDDNRTVEARFDAVQRAMSGDSTGCKEQELLAAMTAVGIMAQALFWGCFIGFVCEGGKGAPDCTLYSYVRLIVTGVYQGYPFAVRWVCDVLSIAGAWVGRHLGRYLISALFYCLAATGILSMIVLLALFIQPFLALHWAISLHTLTTASFRSSNALFSVLPLPFFYLVDHLLLLGPILWYINLHNPIFTLYYPYLHIAILAHLLAGMFDLTPSSFSPSSLLNAAGVEVSVRFAEVNELKEKLREMQGVIEELDKRVAKGREERGGGARRRR